MTNQWLIILLVCLCSLALRTSLSLAQENVITIDEDVIDLVASFTEKADEEKNECGYPVRINEVSPANNCYINDYYKKSDWIELYNTTSSDLDIAGMYLSDDRFDLHKYKIESEQGVNTVIPANGYLVVWCDKKESINQLHVPFKLDNIEGAIYLTSANDFYTDELHYNNISSSETIGHYPDGGKDVFKFSQPTIGQTNISSSYNELVSYKSTPTCITSNVKEKLSLEYYKQGLIVYSINDDNRLKVINSLGQIVHSGIICSEKYYSLDMLPLGLYVVEVYNYRNEKTSLKFVRK